MPQQKEISSITTATVLGNAIQIFTSYDAVTPPPINPDGEEDRVYWGVGAAGLTAVQIKAFSDYAVGKVNRLNLNFNPTIQRYYYAYPSSYGSLVKITDQNGFDVTAAFVTTTVNFTMTDGVTIVSYYVLTSNIDTTQVNFKHNFYFTL